MLEVLADDEDPVAAIVMQQAGDHVFLGGVFAGQAVLVPPFGHGVVHPQGLGQATRTSVQVASAIQPARLQLPPGHVVFLRADQAENIFLAAVLADQRGRQAEPAAGLDLGRDAEDRRGQEVDLVVNDQPPVALIEYLEMGELFLLVGR